MRRALDELVIVGIPTSQAFHRRLMDAPEFARGDYDNEYLERMGDSLLARRDDPKLIEMIAIAAALAEEEHREGTVALGRDPAVGTESLWLRAARLDGLR